nr:hypothetical protein [Tanacetum cinerariifolium]
MPCVTNKLVVCCCKQRVDFRCSGLAVVAASWLPLQWTTPKLLFSILPFTFSILEGEEIFQSAAVAAGRLADVAAGRLSLQWRIVLITQEASGSLEDHEIIQEEYTHPSIDTSLNHEDDDIEIDEPQSDIIPIRRSTRTRRPTDCMCLYIDAKEHELGALGEPANYKAALLDLESDKCLSAMNVEMQSMKDNEVWDLVDLPPNGKTVGSKRLFKKKTYMDGAVHTYKARLVAKGYTQTPRIDYEETFSPVADIRAIRILIVIAALSKSQGASTPAELKRMQNVPYASAVGSIMYDVICTRPDVAFAQNITSRFQQNPGDLHWTTVKNIMKYLRNTKDMFPVYGGDIKRELRVSCYTHAGYLTDADDLKSQTGYVFVLNGGVVDWKSVKQSIFATSSAEAEYIAAFDASNEAIWVRKFISGLGVVSTIEEPISARHFRAKVHDIHEVIEFSDMRLEKVHTDDNLADLFTKALTFSKHSEDTKNIGMLSASGLISIKIVEEDIVVYEKTCWIGDDSTTIHGVVATKRRGYHARKKELIRTELDACPICLEAWTADGKHRICGATCHVATRKEYFSSYTPGDFGVVRMGNTGLSRIPGIGDICLKFDTGMELVLHNVKHVPDMRLNIISTGLLDEDGYHNSIDNDDMTELWHKRLGHMSEKGMSILSKKNVLSGSILNEEMRRKSQGSSSQSDVLVTERWGRSQSRGLSNRCNHHSSSNKGKFADVECYHCHKKGHTMKFCRQLKKENKKKNYNNQKNKHKKDDDGDDSTEVNTTTDEFLFVLIMIWLTTTM